MDRKFVPLLLLFVLIMMMAFIFRPFLERSGFDINFLFIANTILFLVSLLGFFIQLRGLRSINTNAFVRGIFSSLLMKMFVLAIIVLIYVFITEGKVNKPSLFTSMGLYLLYTTLEVKQLMKIASKKI